MKNRFDIIIDWLLVLFLATITLSFSGQLPDMDFMPRLISGSIFAFIFSLATYFIVCKKKVSLSLVTLVNPIIVLFFLFIITLFVSSFNSINANDALFDLLKFTLAFLFLFLFSALLFISTTPLLSLSRAIQFSLLAVLLFGLWQVFTLYQLAVKKHESFLWDYQISSLLSTKNSLAEYLVLSLPLIIYTIIYDKIIWKAIGLVNLSGSLFFLFKLKSFSSFVSIAIVMVVLSTILFISKKDWIIKKTALSSKAYNLLIPFLFTGFFILIIYSTNKIDGFRKFSITSNYIAGNTQDLVYNDNSVFERMLLWKNSASMIREHPWSGVGLANWKILFPSYGYSGAAYLKSDHIKFTRPHNDFLQVFAESGVVSFLTYGLFFLTAVSICLKNYFKSKSNNYLFLFSGVLSFIILSFFGFPAERVLILLIMIMYVAVIVSLQAKEGKKVFTSIGNVVPLSVILITIFSIFSIKVCLARLQDEVVYKRMMYHKERLNWQRMNSFSQQLNGEYFPIDYTATSINWYKGTSLYMQNKSKEALQFYIKAEKQTPYHVQVLNDIGAVYLNTGQIENARNYFDKALSINPDFYEAKLNNVFAVFNSGNKYGAYKMFKSLYPAKRPHTYDENLKVIVYAIADSVLKANKAMVSNNNFLAQQFTKASIWQMEKEVDSSKKNIIEIMNNRLYLLK